MSVLTKDEIASLLVKAMQENEELRKENSELLLIIDEATKKIDVLYDAFKNHYEAVVKVDDTPKHLS